MSQRPVDELPHPILLLNQRDPNYEPRLGDILREVNGRSIERYVKVIGLGDDYATCVTQRVGTKLQRTIRMSLKRLRKMTLVYRTKLD